MGIMAAACWFLLAGVSHFKPMPELVLIQAILALLAGLLLLLGR